MNRAIICALSMVYCLWSMVSYAQPISSTELIEHAKEYDGKAVTYEGEVIGDIMTRGEYAWVNVNDDVNAVGIWAPKSMLAEINHKGTHKEKGDLVEIKGIFHRSCAEHGGDLDIHAENMVKLKDGFSTVEALDLSKVRYAIIFGIILFLVSVWKAYKKWR
jgi:hypothetical protein